MKTTRIVFLCSALSLFFLTSCLKSNDNSQTFSTCNAVISYPDHSGIPFLNTSIARSLAAPELDDKGYGEGDCLLVSFTVDYDNQPTYLEYLAASNINHAKIGKTDIVMLDSLIHNISNEIERLSVDSINSVGAATWPTSSICCIDNNLFMKFESAKDYEYQLVYSDSLINRVPILYVCADKSGEASTSLFGNFRYQAFDITQFLEKYPPNNMGEFSFYLQYKKGENSDGENVYLSPSEMFIFRLINLRFKDN